MLLCNLMLNVRDTAEDKSNLRQTFFFNFETKLIVSVVKLT